jgi:N-acetylglucosaminyl-diphospho-decaprenol L-rhamnosyltransferase
MNADLDPDISVVIVTHNSAHVIDDLLDSLGPALGELSAEVIVVDNASSDDTVAVLDKRKDCIVVRAANDGYAAGINRGVAHGVGRGPVLILNPDVRLYAGSIATLAGALVEGRGITCPRVLEADGSLHYSLRREPTLPRALGLTFTRIPALSECCNRPDDYLRPHAVDWAMGAVLLVSRECFDSLGGWDASFFLYSEETDFSLRAREAGWVTWYEPSAIAVHIGRQSGVNSSIHSMQIVNRVRLYRRRHGVLTSLMYLVLAVGSEGYRAVLGVEQSRVAVRALLVPSTRPAVLNCSTRLLPR